MLMINNVILQSNTMLENPAVLSSAQQRQHTNRVQQYQILQGEVIENVENVLAIFAMFYVLSEYVRIWFMYSQQFIDVFLPVLKAQMAEIDGAIDSGNMSISEYLGRKNAGADADAVADEEAK